MRIFLDECVPLRLAESFGDAAYCQSVGWHYPFFSSRTIFTRKV